MKSSVAYQTLDSLVVRLDETDRDILCQLIDNTFTYGSNGTLTLAHKPSLVEALYEDGRSDIVSKLLWIEGVEHVLL